ncbi:MAG: histidine phosphatase family protein [Thermomicrobiales bacterium]
MSFSFTAERNSGQEIQLYDLIKHPAQGETTLFLIRHGQTIANVSHRLAGVTDVPLDVIGESQAIEMATHLKQIEFDAIVTSPLLRARQTAAAVSVETGHDLDVVHGLQEMNFGLAENMTFEEAARAFPDVAAMIDNPDDPEMGWPDGDTRRSFDDRVAATFLDILRRYVGKRVVVVAHGGVIGTFFAQIVGGNPREFARFSVANCSVTQLVVTPDHTEVHCWNDINHLTAVETTPWQLKLRDEE